MKVILLEKYKKLGEVGEVVEVKNGFARNYLIPNQKATPATKSSIEGFEARKAELVELSKKKEEKAGKIAAKIKDKIVPVIKQAGDDGRLYGAVNTTEIADDLNKVAGTEISRKQVILNNSIKFVGFYQIDIDLGEGVFGEIFLNVSRSAGEAEENAKRFKAGTIGLGPITGEAASKKVEAPKAEVAPAIEETEIAAEGSEETAQ